MPKRCPHAPSATFIIEDCCQHGFEVESILHICSLRMMHTGQHRCFDPCEVVSRNPAGEGGDER